MKVLKNLRLRFFILTLLLGILMGCGSRVSQPDTTKEERQIQENTGNKQKVRQDTDTYIKEIPFKVTPLRFEVYSNIVTICDTLNLEDLKISSGDLLGYNIYLYVHSLGGMNWKRQYPAAAAVKWMAQANLYFYWELYPEPPSLNDGEGFQTIAVMVKVQESPSVTKDEANKNISDTLPQEVKSLRELRQLEGVHIISEIRTAIFRKHQ